VGGEVERAGLKRGRFGVFVEAGLGAGEADRVAREGGELGEQSFVAVAGLVVGGALGLGLAVGGARAGGLGDGVDV